MNFNQAEYKEFDKIMKLKDYKYEIIKRYNKANKTNFQFISQFIQSLYGSGLSSQQVGDTLEMSKRGVAIILTRMKIMLRSRGGRNNLCGISGKAIKDIRVSDESQDALALRHRISQTTVSDIINKKHRWATV